MDTSSDYNSESEGEGASVYNQRKQRRVECYLSGTARAAHKLQPSLERSFSELPLTKRHPGFSPTPQQTARESACNRGCPVGMSIAHKAISRHPAKILHSRKASYPAPKKETLLPYRSVAGNIAPPIPFPPPQKLLYQ